MTDSVPSGRKKWLVFLIVAVLSLVADQATKIWARDLDVVRADGRSASGRAPCVIPDDWLPTRVEGQTVDRPPVCRGAPRQVVDGFWDWRLSMNSGSAFGLFSSIGGARVGLSIVGIVAVIGMFLMLRKSRVDQTILHWALALVTGGAIGNLIDRVYYGVVTDFILWHYKTHEWPVFNVADIVLVVGVGLMLIDIQKESRREKAGKALRAEKAKAAGLIKFGK